MRVIPIVVLVLALSGCSAAARPSFKDPWHVAAMGAGTADIVTTYYALENPNLDLIEANPLVGLCGANAKAVVICATTLRIGFLSLLVWADNKMALTGWAKRIFWLMPVTLWGSAAVWNTQFIWEEE